MGRGHAPGRIKSFDSLSFNKNHLHAHCILITAEIILTFAELIPGNRIFRRSYLISSLRRLDIAAAASGKDFESSNTKFHQTLFVLIKLTIYIRG